MGMWDSYNSLQVADQKAVEDLSGLVAVAYVLESLGRVLTSYVNENFFSAAVD